MFIHQRQYQVLLNLFALRQFLIYLKDIQDDGGQTVAEYRYDAWGAHETLVDVGGIGSLNPIRYRGYYFDVETGLYYLKTRYYDPETGRFVNMDDVWMLPMLQNHINGLNLFAYGNNNPVNMVDPDGRIFGRIWNWVSNTATDAWNTVTGFVNDPVGTVVGWATNMWNSATAIWTDPLGTLGNFALNKISSALEPLQYIIGGIRFWNGTLNMQDLQLNPGAGMLGVNSMFGAGAPEIDPNWRPKDRFQRITGLIALSGVIIMAIGAATIKIPFFGVGMLITGALLAAIFGALSGGSVILTN